MADMMDTALALDAEQEEDTLKGKYLVFFLDGQEYAIPIGNVIDIINIQPITRVPNCPEYVRGITNLRGKAIPIIDVRIRFGKEPQQHNDRTCIIVVEDQGSSVGLIIDSVSEVVNLPDEMISPPPTFSGMGSESKFVQGIGRSETGGVKLILDYKAALNDSMYMMAPSGDEAF